MKRAACIAAVVLALAVAGWWALRGPSPEQILASLELPPAPALSPVDELASFRVAPGFRVELVAAEPLVVAPVAIAWDDAGRLYAVEMRGFMPNLAGEGEDAPTGRVVVLEDTDRDGRMDASHVLRDGLTLPRAIAVLPEGVLLGVPPDLWLCPPFEVEPRCMTPRRLTHYGRGRHDPEHTENGLLPALDGWIYNAKSRRRFWLDRAVWREETTAFRGQWGIAQDDEGRLFTNHNSAFLFADLFPAEYLARHPATDPGTRRPGVAEALAPHASVHGIRVAPGLNRAYLKGVLRRDGRQDGPTAVSGLALNRAPLFGADALGDVFVPEPAGNVVARFRVRSDGLAAEAEQLLTDDPDWGEREFLAGADERFRPVNVAFGPDGALYVVDMYRGVIQHANYVTDHLRAHVRRQGLEAPLELGRIWRVVPIAAGAAGPPPDAAHASTAERITLLDHENGWLRDRAQRWLVHDRDPAAPARLRELERFTARGKLHALFTLAALGALDESSWLVGLRDTSPAVRRAALRAGDAQLREAPEPARVEAVLAALGDADAGVRLQALHSLGEVAPAERPVAALLAAVDAAPADTLVRQAVLSGLGGVELAALDLLLARPSGSGADESWLRELAGAALLGAASEPARAAALLDRVQRLRDGDPRKLALAAGAAALLRRPGALRFELAGPHPLFGAAALAADGELPRALRGVRKGFTWPGDVEPPGVRALSPDESARRERGERLFEASCASCHASDGRGQPGLAPSLVGSPWVLDAEGWLIAIALHGITGPLLVSGEPFEGTMPGFAGDLRFDDDALAGLLTHVRRAWGNAAEPIAPDEVAAQRALHAARTAPFTVEDLLALPVAHRLDRYVGRYGLPVVSIELAIERRADKLYLGVSERGGMGELTARSDGSFATEDPSGGAIVLEFEEDDAGVVTGVSMLRGAGDRIPWSRK